jgi:long-chain acyl-CoA synthetase
MTKTGDTMADESSESLRSMLARVVRQHPERPAITYRVATAEAGGRQPTAWRTLTWHEVVHVVLDVAAALDLVNGPARTVALLADTDARYPILELAIGLTGRVLQPLYVSSTDPELRRALETTGAQLLVVGRSQDARARSAQLHPKIVSLDEIVRLPGVAGAPHAALPPDVEPFATTSVRARLRDLPARAPEVPLLYLQSTGTTGPARVIEISEASLLAAVRAVQGEASHEFPRFLSFLPTAHISERLLTLYVSLALAGHTFYGGGLATMGDDLRACRPTVVLAPPLLLETIRDRASAAARSTGLGRRLLASVDRTAREMLSHGIVGGTGRSVGARLFGHRLRREVGLDRVRDGLTGTAPLQPDLHAWYEAIGIPLRVVYGQTELAGATSITSRRGASFGSVGLPVANVETKISDGGELLVRGGSLFTRYVGDAAATRRTLGGAWLHTGDRAKRAPTGELVLLGRVQALLKVAGGIVVDVDGIVTKVRALLGSSDIVFQPGAAGAEADGGFLYVAIHQTKLDADAPSDLRPLPGHDRRWDQMAGIVDLTDLQGVIRGWALFDGRFGQATGEVGPTGKPRAWRIHELRSDCLRMRRASTN